MIPDQSKLPLQGAHKLNHSSKNDVIFLAYRYFKPEPD